MPSSFEHLWTEVKRLQFLQHFQSMCLYYVFPRCHVAEEKKDQVQNPSGYLKLIWKKVWIWMDFLGQSLIAAIRWALHMSKHGISGGISRDHRAWCLVGNCWHREVKEDCLDCLDFLHDVSLRLPMAD